MHWKLILRKIVARLRCCIGRDVALRDATSQVEVLRHAFETTAVDRDTWRHAFETTEADRDLWKKKYLWLSWTYTHPLGPPFIAGEKHPAEVLRIWEFLTSETPQPETKLEVSDAPSDQYPDFDGMLIGTEKSGTSYIYSCLREAPGVYVGDKDQDFYRILSADPEWFQKLFMSDFRNQPRIVPFDADYIFWEDSAALLQRRSGASLKAILALLRDPIERAVSEYRMRLRQGAEYLPFPAALAESARRKEFFPSEWRGRWAYLDRGLYGRQLQPYLDIFGADKLMVRLFEKDVVRDPRGLVEEFCEKAQLDIPSTETYERMLSEGGLEPATIPPPTVAQSRLGVTEELLKEWLSYFPSGHELQELKAYFADDVEKLARTFDLPVRQYWKTTTPE